MTKGRKRSNRELKKPKQTKLNAPVGAAGASIAQNVMEAFTRGKKRW